MLDTHVGQKAAPRAKSATVEGVKSADRVLQILEFFDDERRACRVSEISRALSFPQSSTSVLLRSLVTAGYLHYDTIKRCYNPTRRVSLLGSWVDPDLIRRGPVLELVENLAAKLEQTVVVASANGMYAQYIYVAGPEPEVRIGHQSSIAHTAVGRALLSQFDDKRVAGMLWRINAERDSEEDKPINCAAFLEHLRAERKTGLFSGRAALAGHIGLAVPLHREGQMIGLGIEGKRDAIEGLRSRLHHELQNRFQAP